MKRCTWLVMVSLATLLGCTVEKRVVGPGGPSGNERGEVSAGPAAPPAVAPSVEGTVWTGEASGLLYTYYFKPGGELAWDSPTAMGNTGGSWHQEGNEIVMETDGHTAKWRGRIAGETMTGDAWNDKGRKWSWKATKQYQMSSPAPSLEGTTWAGTDSDGDYYVYYFNRGGQLSWDSPSGRGNTGGTWRQTGNRIYMETNGRYAEWQGTITGESMTGSAWNQAGHRWSWEARLRH